MRSRRYVKRGGKLWIRVFPDKPITKKPIEVRMGAGKGNVEYWVAQIQPGRMLYEIEGVDEATAREAFRLAAAKLSVQTPVRDPGGDVMAHQADINEPVGGRAEAAPAGPAQGAVQPAHAEGAPASSPSRTSFAAFAVTSPARSSCSASKK